MCAMHCVMRHQLADAPRGCFHGNPPPFPLHCLLAGSPSAQPTVCPSLSLHLLYINNQRRHLSEHHLHLFLSLLPSDKRKLRPPAQHPLSGRRSMDMSSSITSSAAAASAPHNHQQEAIVSSPIIKEEAKQAQDMQQSSGSVERKPRPQLPEALKCPRCNSNNTKFCYYNNYSTTQPRYFCKGCRRYWTHGGALRNVPVGGGCRKNKRASGSVLGSSTSSSSSAAYAPLSPNTNTSPSKININTQLMMVPNMMMPTPTMTGLFPNVLPTLMSTGGGGDFNFTMDNQHASLPFTPMSLSNQASVPMLATGGSETMPSFLELLKRGLHGSSSYDAGLAMSGSNNEMDMLLPLPAYGEMHGHGLSGSTTDDARQLVGNQQGVNTDGGFVGSAGVQEEGDNKAMVKSSKNNNDGSLLDRYWTKPNNNNNNYKGQQG